MSRQGVFLGDVLILISRLRPSEAALEKLLVLAGITLPAEIRMRRSSEGLHRELPDTAALETSFVNEQTKQQPPAVAADVLRPDRVVRIGRKDEPPPAWLNEGGVLSGDASSQMDQPESLFAPSAERAVATLAASTWFPAGRIELRELVRMIANGRPVMRIPRAWAPTVRCGAQVLVDRGDEMVPFDLDCDALVERIRAVVGRSRTSSSIFVGTPLRPGDSKWAPPAPGTAIVLLSALGAGGPFLNPDRATPEEWVHFAHRAQAAGCPVVALSPYPPSRYPTQLRNAIPLIHWDRPTSVRSAQRAISRRRSALIEVN